MTKRKWFILAFRPSYVPLENIVGGAQVRPFELFNAYAAAGHQVNIWETDGLHQEQRVFHGGNLIVRPLKHSFGILSAIPQLLEMRRILLEEVAKAKEQGFQDLCFYNQVPVSVVFRFGLIPMLTQPGILLFDLARKSGMKTWGNMHDLSPEHELSARERVSNKINMRYIKLTAAIHSWIQNIFIPKSHFISTGSLGMKEALIERYALPADRISVMEAGYNPKLVETVHPWSPPKPGEPWTVAYLGSYMDATLEVLVQALRELGRADVKLVLAGRGMSEAVRSHQISWPNTVVKDGAKYSSFSEVANQVDIWAVPLLNRLDLAWQLKMPMYLASGRPTVRTRGKSLDDTGLGEHFFQTGNTSEEFAKTLGYVIDNPQEASRKAQGGHQAAIENMSWPSVADQMLQDLERVTS